MIDKSLEKYKRHIEKNPSYGKGEEAALRAGGRLDGKRGSQPQSSAAPSQAVLPVQRQQTATGDDSPTALPGELAQTRIKKRASKVRTLQLGARQLKDEFSERME